MYRYLVTIWENNDGPAEMPVLDYYVNAASHDDAEAKGYARAKRERIANPFVATEEVDSRSGARY